MLKLPQTNVAMMVCNQASPEHLVAFAHAALFSPAIRTLKTALDRGYLPPFPGLTSKTLAKYTPHSMATAKGHLDATRKNQRSTKPAREEQQRQEQKEDQDRLQAILEELQKDYFPEQPEDGKRTHVCFIAVYETRGHVSSDLTGRFPIPSSSGNHYILFVYDFDSNYIFMRACRNKQSRTLMDTFDPIHKELVKGGCRPKMQRLDNECSKG